MGIKLGIIEPEVWETINSRTGKNNIAISGLTTWIRISSAVNNGLIINSVNTKQNFAAAYGEKNRSGNVGYEFDGKTPVFAENDRSHRPSPVIEGISIENGNRGLSRKAKFTIKCFTLAQAELLTKYFYEPGYVVLVEYGWNNTDSTNQQADLKDGGACEIAKYNSYEHIRKKRIASNGTYDGFMGRITGGGYASGDGETYNIDVELTTLGEIPTYFQPHRSGQTLSNEKSGETYDVADINASTRDSNDIGLGLYQQMYNELPAPKRTLELKSLTDSKWTDKNGQPWTDERNFINVDKEFRDEIIKKYEGTWFGYGKRATTTDKDGNESKGSYRIPTGLEIISEHSFIRLELAFEILNTYVVNLKMIKSKSNCKETTMTYPFVINTVDTVIGAHKYMFSTNGSKLFIPNSNCPKFGLATLVKSTKELKASDYLNIKMITKEDGVQNLNQYKDDSALASKYSFPSTESYPPDGKVPTPGTRERTAKAGNWGYLRNLYINLKYFSDIMNRSNFVSKDIYYEMLNEISMAAGSYWQFELEETPYNPEPETHPKSKNIKFETWDEVKNKRKDFVTQEQHEADVDLQKLTYQISVEDQNFFGLKLTKGDKEIRNFVSKGIDTPFLESSLEMSIPASMRNRILGQACTAKVETTPEIADEDLIGGEKSKKKGFFSDELCPVTKILNDLHKQSVGPVKPPKEDENEEDVPTVEELRKSNFEEYLKIATLVPIPRDRNLIKTGYIYDTDDTSGNIEEVISVITWDDIKMLKGVEKIFRNTSAADKTAVSPILSIDFSFTIHGVSGLKIGDVFKVTDIPSKYKDGVFQIMEQSHDLTDGLWKTSVTAKLRNIHIPK